MVFKGNHIEALVSIGVIYFFIVIGFISKLVFKDELNEKSFILLNLYFLHPILVFWGLTKAPVNIEFLRVPAIYIVIVLICLAILLLVNKLIFEDSKERSIYLGSSLVGNTGNLGIPLGIALFGEQSIPYTSILNIANVFFIYLISIYFFAKEQFNFKEAMKSIFTIPAIWFAFIALGYNYLSLPIGKSFALFLDMGAYSAMVLQLVIFGMYLSQIKLKTTAWKLSLHISFVKHILLPLVGFIVIIFVKIDFYIGAIILMELMVPLAVTNVNMAALYNCRPKDMTSAILVSSLLFIGLVYFYIKIIYYYFGEAL